MTKRRRGGNKRGESSLASNQFPYVLSTVWNTQKGSWSYLEKGQWRKEIEVTKRRRGGNKRGETDPASNWLPKCSPQPRKPKEIHRVG